MACCRSVPPSPPPAAACPSPWCPGDGGLSCPAHCPSPPVVGELADEHSRNASQRGRAGALPEQADACPTSTQQRQQWRNNHNRPHSARTMHGMEWGPQTASPKAPGNPGPCSGKPRHKPPHLETPASDEHPRGPYRLAAWTLHQKARNATACPGGGQHCDQLAPAWPLRTLARRQHSPARRRTRGSPQRELERLQQRSRRNRGGGRGSQAAPPA